MPEASAKRIVFIASHLGYSMDRTPLGGGAMVGLHLVKHWSADKTFKLKVLGSGPMAPVPDADYVSCGAPESGSLVRLSELEYARFCRLFEKASTAWLVDHQDEWPPGQTCVVVNDVSESPEVGKLVELGYPLLSIWHVDVVDFFNKMYFHNLFRPERWVNVYDKCSRLGLSWAVPDLLKLVFDKQQRIVDCSGKLVLPSKRMAETLLSCYGKLGTHAPKQRPLAERIQVIPWGCWDRAQGVTPSARPQADMSAWDEPQEETGALRASQRLRAHYQLRPDSRVLMTMSRISPEKGIRLLLEALQVLENDPERLPKDLCLFVCGEPSFMQGKPYARQVRAAAERLKKVRIFFPGHLSPPEKQAYFKLADLFVSPAIHESYGLTIVEAMAAGLPVLASDHSGSEEILRPEFSRIVPYDGKAGAVSGWLRRRGDIPHRLADSLWELLKNPEALKTMGEAAKTAAQDVTFKSAAQKVAESALGLLAQ